MGTRVALIYAGQAPRPDIRFEPIEGCITEEFGALDGLTTSEIAAAQAAPGELALLTRIAGGQSVAVRASYVANRLQMLLARLDQEGFSALVLLSTGIFRSFATRTPLIHGQKAVDAWIGALVLGDCRIGLIHPLPQQDSHFADMRFGTMVHSAKSIAKGRLSQNIAEASQSMADADLIVMHSVGYTEEMAKEAARVSGRPVVTATRIIIGALRARLAEASADDGPFLPKTDLDGTSLVAALNAVDHALTPRECDVMALVLEGDSNKVIARRLNISHRTVDIHRARGMSKLGAKSVADLIRRAIMLSAHGLPPED
ncbi:hypothetical protein shn_29070 (plasmid) [Shinella sp. HZN7]|nr:hypothetical protein shn_29070 [Shinella sp. HZN7]